MEILDEKLRNLRFENFSDETKNFFLSESRWKYKDIYTEQDPIVIPGGTLKSYIELRNWLFNAIPKTDILKKHKNTDLPRNVRNDADAFGKYIRGERPSGPPLGFELINKSPIMLEAKLLHSKRIHESKINFSEQQQEKTRKKTIDPLLEKAFQNDMFWSNGKIVIEIPAGEVKLPIDCVRIFHIHDPVNWKSSPVGTDENRDQSRPISEYLKGISPPFKKLKGNWELLNPCKELVELQKKKLSVKEKPRNTDFLIKNLDPLMKKTFANIMRWGNKNLDHDFEIPAGEVKLPLDLVAILHHYDSDNWQDTSIKDPKVENDSLCISRYL